MPPSAATRSSGPLALGIGQDRGVELARALDPALDQQALDALAADRHAEDRLRRRRGLGRRRRRPDAARLAAPAGADLRLDHAGPEPRHRACRRLGALDHLARRHRDAGGREQGLGGMLREVHRP